MAMGRRLIARPHRIRDVGAVSTGSVQLRPRVVGIVVVVVVVIVIVDRLAVVIVEAKVEVVQRTGWRPEHQIGIEADRLCCHVTQLLPFFLLRGTAMTLFRSVSVAITSITPGRREEV